MEVQPAHAEQCHIVMAFSLDIVLRVDVSSVPTGLFHWAPPMFFRIWTSHVCDFEEPKHRIIIKAHCIFK